jgi:hypothetical protein
LSIAGVEWWLGEEKGEGEEQEEVELFGEGWEREESIEIEWDGL